eukprot:1159635-Pelagomonas_calceolata.AAC.4
MRLGCKGQTGPDRIAAGCVHADCAREQCVKGRKNDKGRQNWNLCIAGKGKRTSRQSWLKLCIRGTRGRNNGPLAVRAGNCNWCCMRAMAAGAACRQWQLVQQAGNGNRRCMRAMAAGSACGQWQLVLHVSNGNSCYKHDWVDEKGA